MVSDLLDLDKQLVVLQGNSNSGKSTYSNFLVSLGYVSHHPIDFYVRRLEKQYDLVPHTLDTQEGKHMVMNPTTDKTFLDYLVEWYHLTQKVDPNFSAKSIKIDLEDLARLNKNIVVQSIRSLPEIQAVINFSQKFKYSLIIVNIYSIREIPRSSDLHNNTILDYCKNQNIKVLEFDNSGTKADGKDWIIRNLCTTL